MPRSEGRKHHQFNHRMSRFIWQDDDIVVVERTKNKSEEKKSLMKLTTEGGLERSRPSAKFVLSVLNELDTGKGNSFCCLESSDDNYVQTLHGLNGWHLEWREIGSGASGSYRHYRAAKIIGSNRKRLLRKSDKFTNSGLERDLLNTEDVQQCFLAFLRSEARPKHFEWRRLKV